MQYVRAVNYRWLSVPAKYKRGGIYAHELFAHMQIRRPSCRTKLIGKNTGNHCARVTRTSVEVVIIGEKTRNQ